MRLSFVDRFSLEPPAPLQRLPLEILGSGNKIRKSGLSRQHTARADSPPAPPAPPLPLPPLAAPQQQPPPVQHVAAAPMDTRVLCSGFLSDGGTENGEGEQLAVVLLNWTLPALTARLWHKATLRVCADGGANRLFDELPPMLPGQGVEAVRVQHLPSVIKGDLDSIRPDVRQFYQQAGVPIEDLSEDQDSTDLQKCLQYVREQAQEQGIPLHKLTLVALGALGGRLDHTLSNLSTLHSNRDLNLVLMGDGNLARLVPAGRSVIRPDRSLEGPSCGLVTLVGPAVASSSGLRWNLDQLEMRVGGLISTSNLIEADEISVESDTDLVWTTQLKHL